MQTPRVEAAPVERHEDSAEHHVSMHVAGLMSSVAALVEHAKSSGPLVAREREFIADTHAQLGRMLARLPVAHKEAAE